jgi:integrase/recombinase XerC
MVNELVPARGATGTPALSTPAIVDAWLQGRNERTLRAYRFDLTDFARFMGVKNALKNPAAAVEILLAGGPGLANECALRYVAHMKERKLSDATIARRLAALRSLVKLGRQLGRITWSIDIQAPKVMPYRDTRGPGLGGWQTILKHAKGRVEADDQSKEAKRNLALIRLMHDLALRRGEAIAMDLEDVDLDGGEHGQGQLRIIGKGRRDKETLSLGSKPARDALAAWIVVRGDEPGPLFTRLDRASNGQLERLTGDSVCRMVRRLSRRAGLKRETRPHGLRHQGITRALDLTNGNVRKVQRFSRHLDPRTLGRYDDNRQDDAGHISRQLGDDE